MLIKTQLVKLELIETEFPQHRTIELECSSNPEETEDTLDDALTHFYEDDIVKVKFQDTGVGIEPEDLDKIFNPFYTKKVGSTVTGTGLGLSMAHKIIGKHKGTITAQSEGKGKGATFAVTLPVDKEGKSRK